MSTVTLLQLCLVLHLTGLIMMAGMSIADRLAYSNFWKAYAADKQQGLVLYNAAASIQKFLALGAVLLLLTGVGMMALTHGVFGEQLWMRIKIGIVVLIIINGPVLGRMQGARLKAILLDTKPGTEQQVMTLKRRLNIMSVANLIFLASIVILSVFKFN